MSARAALRARGAIAWLAASALLLGLGLGCGGAPESDSALHVLRYASPYSPVHPFSRADLSWIAHVEAEARGRLRIQPFWSGTLLSAEQGMLELRHGVADIGLIQPIYARGGTQAIRAQAGFYAGARSVRSQTAIYRCLAAEFPIFDREIAGLTVLAVQGGNLPALLTRNKPVRALRDLAGLRLRAPAELTEILTTLGADPISMPMGEVYAALAKGVIDGVVAPADALRSLHFADVVHYLTQLEVPRGAYPARAISRDALQRLPPDLQAIVLASRPTWEAALERELAAAMVTGERYGKEHGVVFLPFAPIEQQRFHAIYNAAARSSAQDLARFGIDGVAILERAQALVQQSDAGPEAPCQDPAGLSLGPSAARHSGESSRR
jgi:TRAP-type transport system periplasmic protein